MKYIKFHFLPPFGLRACTSTFIFHARKFRTFNQRNKHHGRNTADKDGNSESKILKKRTLLRRERKMENSEQPFSSSEIEKKNDKVHLNM